MGQGVSHPPLPVGSAGLLSTAPQGAASPSLTLVGRWKPARCRGASGCRGVELSRTWGGSTGGSTGHPVEGGPIPWGWAPSPGGGLYLVLGLPAEAAEAVGLSLQLAGEGEHLQVGGREAGVVPGLLGEVGHCGRRGRGRGKEPSGRARPQGAGRVGPGRRGPVGRFGTHRGAGRRAAGGGGAARRAARPNGGASACRGSRPAPRARCTGSARCPAGSAVRPAPVLPAPVPPSPSRSPPSRYLQRGGAEEGAGVGHDVGHARHVCAPHVPRRHPYPPRCPPGAVVCAGQAGNCRPA